MPKLKYRIASWFTRLTILASIILSIAGLSFFTEITTLFWHIRNPQPLNWKNFKVHVPNNMVGVFLDPHRKDFLVINLENPDLLDISFNHFPLKLSSSAENEFFETQYETFEKIPCKIDISPCIWVKGNTKDSSIFNYKEQIYIESQKAMISFSGSPENRSVFLNILKKIEFPNP